MAFKGKILVYGQQRNPIDVDLLVQVLLSLVTDMNASGEDPATALRLYLTDQSEPETKETE